MFADIRKKFFAALVGSLMFFGAPGCSAVGGAGAVMIGSGILSTLYGGYETFFGVINTAGFFSGGRQLFDRRTGEPFKADGRQTLDFIVQGIVRGATFLGSGFSLIAGGMQH